MTGGTGLIGSHIAEALRAAGREVVALVRPTSDTRHLEALGCRTVTGDILDSPDALAERMAGCGAVVHTAAKVFQGGSRRDFLRSNVDGTERVLEAAARAAPRVVHLSSVAVYAGLPLDAPLTEERWTEANPDRQHAYAASKHLAERAAWRVHDEGRVRLTTLRPSVVYGERDRSATRVFVRVVRLPVVPLVGGGRTTVPVVYAGNIARAAVAALEREVAVGRAYNVALDEPVTARELVERFAAGLGRRARIVSIPGAPAAALAAVAETLTRLVPFVRTADVGRAVRSLRYDNPYDSSRARLELGWTNLVPHGEAARRTMTWWRSREAE